MAHHSERSRRQPGLDEWLGALEAVTGYRPRRYGNGWSARCPAHEDKHPSLSVSEGDAQPVVATCHKGCTFEAIRAALRLDPGSAPAAELQVVAARPAKGREPTPKPLPAGAHVYRDTEGRPLMATLRRDLADGGKTFSQWTPKGDGWVPVGLPAPRPLYGLPELAAEPDRQVVVVEGEKCAEAVAEKWGELATTWPGGSKQWQHADWTPIAGRRVAIVADADTGGRDASTGIAHKTHALGCEVRLALPEGETGEDVADWLEQGPEYAHKRIAELLQPFEPDPGYKLPPEPDAEREGSGELGLYGGGNLGLEPLADARRLLDTYADRLMLAKGRNERGEVETAVYALLPSGLWTRDPETLASWHDERAEWWESEAVKLVNDEKAHAAIGRYFRRVRTISGAREAVGNVPILAHHLRERDQLHGALTECDAADLDAVRWLGAPNGVIDLHTGRLLPPAEGRRALVTRWLPDPYDPSAEHRDAELLTAHVPTVLAVYVWDSFGFSLLGQPSRRFLVVIGPPGGGKTTIARAVAAALGCYAGPLAEGAIAPTRGGRGANAPTPDMASIMPPRRLALGAEVEKMRPDVARLKAATGGDPLPRRELYQPLSEGVPTATLVLFGNQAPERLGLDDQAVVDRARAVPYPGLPEGERDSRLVNAWNGDDPEAVRRRQAVAAKLVRHAANQTPGVPPEPPAEVLAYVDELREADIGEVGVWLRDRVRRGSEGDVLAAAEVHRAIGDALGAEGEGKDWRVDGLSRQQVTVKLRNLHGLGQSKSHTVNGVSVRGWRGWRIEK